MLWPSFKKKTSESNNCSTFFGDTKRFASTLNNNNNNNTVNLCEYCSDRGFVKRNFCVENVNAICVLFCMWMYLIRNVMRKQCETNNSVSTIRQIICRENGLMTFEGLYLFRR